MNRTTLYCLILASCAECSILIFLFYWAPWLDMIARYNGDISAGSKGNAVFPDAIIYSCYLISSILGTYLAQMYLIDIGEDLLLQSALLGLSIFFFLGAGASSPSLVFIASIGINLCIGAYWALINLFRNRYTELMCRDTCTLIGRLIAAILCVIILSFTYHNSSLTLILCSTLMTIATYVQYLTIQIEPTTNLDQLDK